ncbi:hypothetical protein ACHAWT_002230 [Skeletonema menzelii]
MGGSSNSSQNTQQRRHGRQRQRQRLSASAHISRDQIEYIEPECVLMPIQEGERVPLTIDASSLNDEELDQLKKEDPFLYYSIPSIRYASLRGGSLTSSQGSVGSGSGHRQFQHLRQSAPATLMSAAASVAAETTVRRKTRISFELSFDEVMSDLIESIGEGLDVGNEDESFDDILDQISSSGDLSFRRST